jgi:catechol 2,3-dioxygenase-like lactoylglutathione lyase family enzyme
MTQINALYPRLVVADAARAIDFYVAALGATETQRHAGPDGKIVHAEVTIGAARVAVKDEGDGDPAPRGHGGLPRPRCAVRRPRRAPRRPIRPPLDDLAAARRPALIEVVATVVRS